MGKRYFYAKVDREGNTLVQAKSLKELAEKCQIDVNDLYQHNLYNVDVFYVKAQMSDGKVVKVYNG